MKKSRESGRADQPNRTYVLRGYAKGVSEHEWVAVCLTLNLVAQGRTSREAMNKLFMLCEAYMRDAFKDGEMAKWVPRRAPFAFYLEYWMFRFAIFIHQAKQPLMIFSEARPLPQHA